MGLLDFFGGSSGDRALRKHAGRVANKRAQAADRWDSIHALAEMKSAEAAAALCERFTFKVDPSITDQEEKEAALKGLLSMGGTAVEPIVAFLKRTESMAWPFKALVSLCEPDDVTGHLLDLLEGMDTEYERDPQKKIQVLAALEERRDPRITEAAATFVEDMNENARFHALGAVFAQEDAEEHRELLLRILVEEDSNRLRARIIDGFLEKGWSTAAAGKELAGRLPTGYVVAGNGEISKA